MQERVREADATDISDICVLLAELRGGPVEQDTIAMQFEAVLGDKHRTVLVIEDAGAVVGTATVNLLFKLPKIEARIDEVVVSSSQRGKGYGAVLVEACEAWAWEHGADVIELTSRPSREAANRLYAKLGYTIRETNVYNKVREV